MITSCVRTFIIYSLHRLAHAFPLGDGFNLQGKAPTPCLDVFYFSLNYTKSQVIMAIYYKIVVIIWLFCYPNTRFLTAYHLMGGFFMGEIYD